MDNQNFGNNFQQPNFQQMYQQPMNNGLAEPVTFGEWIIFWLIMCVPCLNIIMLFVWAFGSNTKLSKANFCKAYLVVYAVILVLIIIIFAIFGAALTSFFGSLSTINFIF